MSNNVRTSEPARPGLIEELFNSTAVHAPTAEQMELIAGYLRILVDQPPGYRGEAQRGRRWAKMITRDRVYALQQLERVLTSPPRRQTTSPIRKRRRGGSFTTTGNWPRGTGAALQLAEELATELLKKWGLHRFAELPVHPAALHGDDRDFEPTPDKPLIVPGLCREQLAWVLSVVERGLSTLTQPRLPKKRTSNSNDERDEFIYRRFLEGMTYDGIMRDLNHHRGWAKLGSATAVRKALERFCERRDLRVPSRRKHKA
jgi:hypothetical protein